jgi:histone acetyltransferase 1
MKITGVVGSAAEFDDDSIAFHPVWTHNVYADEKIIGYKDLKVNLYYTAAATNAYLSVSYSEKREGAPDLYKDFTQFLSYPPQGNKQDFLKVSIVLLRLISYVGSC